MSDRLQKLRDLKPGWNSYDALAITPEALAVATIMLHPPSITPCADGGIQFEWHQNGYDIEFVIPPAGVANDERLLIQRANA